jgi:hypothetical protein
MMAGMCSAVRTSQPPMGVVNQCARPTCLPACLQGRSSSLQAENSDLLLRVARLERHLALTQQANYDLQATVMGLQQRPGAGDELREQVRQQGRLQGCR